MRMEGWRESGNVEDRRGMGRGLALGGGGSILALLAYLIFGGGGSLFTGGGSPSGSRGTDDEAKRFVSRVLADTEDVWTEEFRKTGKSYAPPKLVLFDGQVESACGLAGSAVGPFYCPGDHQVYLDLEFFRELDQRFGAPGDFAQAYVIAHEVGHHVQRLLGTMDRVDREKRRVDEVESNRLSVRVELQADFLAGVWAHHAQRRKNFLEPNELDEALRAASAIGDDRLQRQGRGRVVPDSFTHGTSAQRARWFKHGFRTGDVSQGDTFSVRYEDL
jgi:uncharacterized protein